jgi:hypothetical protein
VREPNFFEWLAIEQRLNFLNTPQSVTASYKRCEREGKVFLSLDSIVTHYPNGYVVESASGGAR